MHRLEEMIEHFCEGLDEKMHKDKHDDYDYDKDHDMDHEKDWDKDHHRMLAGHGDHDDEKHRDHGYVKDMYLCMQAKQMAWDLKEYMHGDEHDKMRQSRGWMKDIKEMKRDWGMDGASNLAMAGAAMIVAVSALSF